MAMDVKWCGVLSDDGTLKGPNDSGICTFSVAALTSLVRETIQNALDADKVNPDMPILVEFKKFSIAPNEFPGIKEYKDIIDKCMNSDESNRTDTDIQDIFGNAQQVLSGNVDVLRISDFNTCGLLGAVEGQKGSKWSRLIKEQGTSNNNLGAQGSFGIGKAAPFVCSLLRTVFYSSLDAEGVKSNIGVARFVSYKDDAGNWTTGDVYWSKNKKAILELTNIDKEFERTQSGTDLYVMGMRDDTYLEEKIILAIVMNFFIAIWKGNLVVRVNGKDINKDNLGSIVESLPEDVDRKYVKNKAELEAVNDLKHYYELLTMGNNKCYEIPLEASCFNPEYGFEDGEAKLLLLEGSDLNRRILMTRKSGMKLFEQNRISSSLSFTGILLITGEKMNSEFRKMETASHDKWEPAACRNRKEETKLANMYKELRKCLRDKVEKQLVDTESDIIDAYGINEFLPFENLEENEGKILKEKVMAPPKIRSVKKMTSKPSKVSKKDLTAEDFGPDEDGFNFRIKPFTKRRRKTEGATSGIDTGMEKGFKTDNTIVRQALICEDRENGVYKYQFIAPSNKNEKLDFFINGERGDYKLYIESVEALEGTAKVIAGEDNKIVLSSVRKGQIIKLKIKVPFNKYCKLEVNHYEAKK